MKVTLLEHTSPKVIMTGRNTCYSAKGPVDIYNNIDVDNDKILDTLSSGHTSIAEHLNFTFAIEGISRACSHQFVRHRHVSFSQKSQRYITEYDQFKFITPESIANDELEGEYILLMAKIQKFYSKCIDSGIKAEDARMVLPNACTTDMTVTMNLRELIHLCNERLCKRAQSEIREMVHTMAELVVQKSEFEFLAPLLQPKCVKLGKCPEAKPCKN